MYILNEDDQKGIMNFIRRTGLNNFPDANTPEADFLSATFRFHEFIIIFDGCSDKAADAYLKATQKAVKEARKTNGSIEEQKESYNQIMTEEFYCYYIQYKWQQVKTQNKHSSAPALDLYQGYLAALDVLSYVDHTPLLVL